jgi:hypothetical protein
MWWDKSGLRPCGSARKYVVLGVVRLTGVGTVISRRGADDLLRDRSFKGHDLLSALWVPLRRLCYVSLAIRLAKIAVARLGLH